MPSPDRAKQAEKEYARRAGTLPWERTKPFAPPGHDMVSESAALIRDFAVLLVCLAPAPGERLLDLGAGSGWVSEWLQRLHVDSVAVDLSIDLLRVAGERLPRPGRLVAGDLELLPFGDGVFDAAASLNAFHHLQDMRQALREVYRVLKPGGRVLFSEPGRGHAEAATSKHASESFGVTEQEVLVAPFLSACQEAGFQRVRLKPLAYVVPYFEADLARWTRWHQIADTPRPLRAGRRLWLAMLELAGLGKRGPLFQDAVGMELLRILRHAMEDHPVIVASKG
ncbi:MAG TPA: class I SAM-dependent methyltransferase [Vicinamibacterales bacterium]|nr:class I SAM-dependent methyltransferase [Vicinamibacterales bacterium]